MKQVKLYDNTHESLSKVVKQRKQKEPHKGWNIQNVVADLIEKAEKREIK